MRNAVFAWIALASVTLLLIPLIAMQFTAAVNWDIVDFVVMAILLFGSGSLFVLMARKLPRRYWIALAAVLIALFLLVWLELAVGLLT